jgi:hypothetical protein
VLAALGTGMYARRRSSKTTAVSVTCSGTCCAGTDASLTRRDDGESLTCPAHPTPARQVVSQSVEASPDVSASLPGRWV